ncbi:MAG: hypothetical protein ABSC89_12145 [Verrucomicrobiota bacterium]
MSAAEILSELPKLTELAAENGDIALCDQAALEGAMMLDRREEEDVRRQQR